MMKGFVFGFVLAVVLLAGGLYYYFASGMAPVAVADPPMPFEKKMAHMALNAHIAKQSVGESPVAADETNLLAGAEVYMQHCAGCHGLPDHPAEVATGMYPRPPQLFKGKGVTDDPASETYWKTVHGIRLTGMPGFKSIISETQAWQVSQLLAHANEITQPVKAVLVPVAPAPAAIRARTPPPK